MAITLRIAGLSLALCALAAASAVAAADKPAQPDPNEKICRSEAQTGTRFRTRTCRTRAEWDAISEQARRDAADLANAPRVGKGGD